MKKTFISAAILLASIPAFCTPETNDKKTDENVLVSCTQTEQREGIATASCSDGTFYSARIIMVCTRTWTHPYSMSEACNSASVDAGVCATSALGPAIIAKKAELMSNCPVD